jgi:acetyltransferase-like isoleucine patch superfamily enzyme
MELRGLGKINLLNSLYFSTRFSPKIRILIFRKASVKIKSSAVVQGQGKLSIGCTWPAYCYFPTLFAIWEKATLMINGDFRFYTGCRVVVDEGAKLEIGSGFLNTSCSIACFKSIKIGQGVRIADDVTIRDSDNHTILGENQIPSKPIVIGDNVWIGMNSTILKGVTIGDGAVIAAGSVVIRDIPPRTLAGGVPAKVIREKIAWL